MLKKKINRTFVFLTSLLLCLMLFFGMSAGIMKVFAAGNSNYDTEKVLYLSDRSRITHEPYPASFSLDNTRLFMAPTQLADIPGGVMQAKIEGAWYTFEYGVYAHASSLVTFNISEFSNEYKYFSAYGGLLSGATQSNGVLLCVQTSQDGKNWTTVPPSDTSVGTDGEGRQLVKYNQNFLHFTLDVTGVKWIRLYANNNGNKTADWVVWADAKLTTTLDAGGAAGKSLAAYDAEIKAKVAANADLNDNSLELLVLQREFVSRVGQYALNKFRSESADNTAMLDGWLLKDLDVLREFMLGGAPFKGNYYNSLTVLSELYKYYKADLNDSRPLKYNKWAPGRTYGELYRTMMFAVALTHDGTIGSYLQGSKPQNQSDPLRRYAIYRYLYETERFVATASYETMSLFGSLKVEEMRWIMSNIIDDESILWLNDYVQTRINANPKNAGNLHTPHSYVRYTDPNYNNPVFYANENYDYFNKLFAVDERGDNGVANNNNKYDEGTVGAGKVGLWDTSYTVPAGEGQEPYVITVSRSGEGEAKLQKVWMNFNNKFKTGSVCGGISKSGCNIRGARGVPANVIGQPGHAAILYYSKDANGNGNWKIDNDVGGWVAATKNERHLLGWGNATWQRNSGGGGTVVYFHLAQECLNDYDNYVKAEEYTWLAKVYQGDLDKQENLYEKALTAQVKNLDAWYGLVRTYKAKTNKTAGDFGSLATRIGNTLWNHPLAMHCLFRLFLTDTGVAAEDNILSNEAKAALTSPALTTQLKTVEVAALQKAKTSGSAAAKSKVNLILGSTDTAIADFSFDGENAGCIVWSDAYSDGTFTWKYSVDGKATWKEVTFEEGQSHAYQLPEEDLAKITTENDIYVYVVGASPDNAYKIDVAAKPTMPDTLYANDWENRVIGVDATYEWRYCTANAEGEYKPTSGWIAYSEGSPDCSGNKAVEVRLKGTAKKPASDSKVFTFTTDTNTAERKYISVDYLTIDAFSTESQDAARPNYAANAIDGNAKTYWHTDYSIDIKHSTQGKDKTPIPRVDPFLTIKLDVPRYISGLEFVQRQYNPAFSIFAKDVKVYVSEDGVNWSETPAATREGFENIDDLKVVHFAQSVYGQYVKLVMTARYETNTNDGVFTTVSMVNLYEDTTKTKSPTGETMPSLADVTPGKDSSAGLGAVVSESEAVSITGFGNKKSNSGVAIAVAVICCVLVLGAGATVFVLYKRGKIKIGGKNVTDKGSKPKASATKQKASTPAPKASAPAPKASAPAPKASAPAPKASTPAPKASTPAPKASAPAPKASTPAPKASAPAPKVISATPKASTPVPKASTPAPKASTPAPKASAPAPKASTPAPKASTPAPKASTPTPKASTPAPKVSTPKPKNK